MKQNEEILKKDQERKASVSRCYANTENLVKDIRDELKQDIAERHREQRDDIKGIRSQLTDVLKGVSNLEGRNEK